MSKAKQNLTKRIRQEKDPEKRPAASVQSWQAIRDEIDPSMGPPAHQADLNEIHEPAKPKPQIGGGSAGQFPDHSNMILRC